MQYRMISSKRGATSRRREIDINVCRERAAVVGAVLLAKAG